LQARIALVDIFQRALTLKGDGQRGWQSQYRFPFVNVGEHGVYNITPDYGVLGVEIRSIPQDDLNALLEQVRAYCQSADLEVSVTVNENGIACDPDNPYLLKLLDSVRAAFGQAPALGKKLPGTSARFAPRGQGVVWGQSGLNPHARDERHYIPSIEGYYRALVEYGKVLSNH
jgi:acetylornithine deacetylase/succinyl-diaminopimelate desuccinylase-like protein